MHTAATPRSGHRPDTSTAPPRDRLVDAARATSILAVALGHWLVLDLRRDPAGGLVGTDVLARLPGLQHLSWLFQVMPVFFFAGGIAAFRSWRRHASPGAWIATRTWRLLWPTLLVTAFWVVATQVGHLFGVDDRLLAATDGIALVVWFLAVYAVVTALVPVLEHACARFGMAVPIALGASAVVVDLIAGATGYTSSSRPSWVWVNYLSVWGAITCLGRWWPVEPTATATRRGVVLAVASGTALVVLTGVGWYPVSMVGVTGASRSNTLPPTVALLALGLLQVGVLTAARPHLDRWLRRPRVYGVVALVGARAMTVYLWHLLAVAVLAVAVVLPGWWRPGEIGSGRWWVLRPVWVLAATIVTVPVVWLVGRVEHPPTIPLTSSTRRAAAGVAVAAVGWAALAIQGFHVPSMPGGVPALALTMLVAGAVLLVDTPAVRSRLRP